MGLVDFGRQTLGFCDKHKYERSKEANLLRARLALVEREQRRAEIARNRTRNLLLPISRLPLDILSEILVLSVSPINRHLWKSSALTTCSRWRTCAIGSPRFWSIVPIDYHTGLDALDIWMSRSAAAMLYIRFSYIDANATFEQITKHFTTSFRVVSDHGSRMRSLAIDGIPSLEPLLPLDFPAPSLREVCLTRLALRLEDPPAPLPLLGQQTSSNIQRLAITSISFCRNAVHLYNLQSSNLAYLDIDESVTIESVQKILPNCQSLAHLKWSCSLQSESSESLDWVIEPFSLPSLFSLTIHGNVSISLIQAATFPKLRYLCIGDPMRPMADVLPHIARQKHLRQLVLRRVSTAVREQFTTLFRDLTRLRLFSCDTWTLFALRSLDTLIEYSEDRVGSLRQLHCPELRDLFIEGDGSHQWWGRNQEILEGALEKHLKPLMRRRGGQHGPKLVVHLKGLSKFARLENVEGIRFK